MPKLCNLTVPNNCLACIVSMKRCQTNIISCELTEFAQINDIFEYDIA